MADIKLTPVERFFRSVVQRYDHEKYWKYRAVVLDPKRGTKLGDCWRLFYIKRADAFNNASMGTHRNCGAAFDEPPNLPHGLNGIIVSHNAVIGKDCIIGAGAVVTGKTVAPDGSLLLGSPAKVIKPVTAEQIEENQHSAEHYVELAQKGLPKA